MCKNKFVNIPSITTPVVDLSNGARDGEYEFYFIFFIENSEKKNIVLQYKNNMGMVSFYMRFICIRHET